MQHQIVKVGACRADRLQLALAAEDIVAGNAVIADDLRALCAACLRGRERFTGFAGAHMILRERLAEHHADCEHRHCGNGSQRKDCALRHEERRAAVNACIAHRLPADLALCAAGHRDRFGLCGDLRRLLICNCAGHRFFNIGLGNAVDHVLDIGFLHSNSSFSRYCLSFCFVRVSVILTFP